MPQSNKPRSGCCEKWLGPNPDWLCPGACTRPCQLRVTRECRWGARKVIPLRRRRALWKNLRIGFTLCYCIRNGIRGWGWAGVSIGKTLLLIIYKWPKWPWENGPWAFGYYSYHVAPVMDFPSSFQSHCVLFLMRAFFRAPWAVMCTNKL